VIGAAAQRDRETQSLSGWAYTMAHAVPLSVRTGFGETYRRGLQDSFERQRGHLRDDAYQRFRRGRNELRPLARSDSRAQALALGTCVADAARFMLLAFGEPYPATKWLMHEVDRVYRGTHVSDVMHSVLGPTKPAERRYKSLWDLWEIVDRKALSAGVDWPQLMGSPFVPS
jgi:hypothetical protein